MRVAYLTIADPADVHAWSGTNHGILDALRRQPGVEVVPVGPLRAPLRTGLAKARTALHRALPGARRHLWTRDLGRLRALGREAGRRLSEVDCDVVLSPGTEPVAFLSTDKPVVVWTDAPFDALVDYYPWYSHLGGRSLREGKAADTRAFGRCARSVFSSQWAADEAVARHGADPARVRVLPFGANLHGDVAEADLDALAVVRLGRPWRFLFVAVEWARKGGDIVLAVVRELNRRGFPAEMVVAGCTPPRESGPLPEFVRLEGFISKRTPEGRARLRALYREALFYFMPSRAEASAIVFGEAAAFGLPSLAPDTGGIPSLVENGVSGQRFAPGTPTAAYVDYILATVSDPVRYRQLSAGALRVSRERLNWESSGAGLRDILAEARGQNVSPAPEGVRPRVSVIVPTFNRRATLLETVASVRAQTFRDFELIIVNDGGSDDTKDALAPLAEAGAIRYLEQPNRGLAAARNHGLAQARGELVAFLDDDDLWPADKLAWQVAELDEHPEAEIVAGTAETMDARGGRLGEGPGLPRRITHEELFLGNPVHSVGQALLRTSTVRAIGGFSLTVPGVEDYDLWLQLARRQPLLGSNRVALRYRMHAGSMSKKALPMFRETLRVIRRHLPHAPATERAARYAAACRWLWFFSAWPLAGALRRGLRDGNLPEAARAARALGFFAVRSLRDPELRRRMAGEFSLAKTRWRARPADGEDLASAAAS